VIASKYFKRDEFKCKCGNCDFDTIDADLVAILNDVREYFDKPVIVTSACRCADHNRKVGGKKNSQHLKGRATDIVVKGVESWEVFGYLESHIHADRLGIGFYDDFTHVDTRGYRARW
jgi:uncharacterized protein YcbK (DUF882 family)